MLPNVMTDSLLAALRLNGLFPKKLGILSRTRKSLARTSEFYLTNSCSDRTRFVVELSSPLSHWQQAQLELQWTPVSRTPVLTLTNVNQRTWLRIIHARD